MRAELAAKLKAGGCTLYFDTNEIRGRYADEVKAFNNFCRQVQRLQQFEPPMRFWLPRMLATNLGKAKSRGDA